MSQKKHEKKHSGAIGYGIIDGRDGSLYYDPDDEFGQSMVFCEREDAELFLATLPPQAGDRVVKIRLFWRY